MSNTSDQPPEQGTIDRRVWLGRAGSLAAAFTLAPAACRLWDPRAARLRPPPLAFGAVPRSHEDAITLPEGYGHQVLAPWGTWLDGRKAAFSAEASGSDQQQQVGSHHDGMSYFPIDARWDAAEQRLVGSSTHGYLAINHEYTDEGLLHADGIASWNADKVKKSKAAVGVSILTIEEIDGRWQLLAGRRVSGLDSVEIHGPARGHALMRTSGEHSTPAERAGTGVDGTMSNCANGQTPWGTYLTCEENFQDQFGRSPGTGGPLEPMMQRYRIGKYRGAIPGSRSIHGWELHDPRFDADLAEYRNHSHRYGWVVEIDPTDPERRPAKRTALGRFRHENAAVIVAPDDRIVVYMGDDEEFEYLYKFVSDGRFEAATDDDTAAERQRKRRHNWTLLDHGKLFAARFEADGHGIWEELDYQRPELRGVFASPAEVMIFARHAADLVKATDMDRPEWVTFDSDPSSRRLRHAYLTLTNNSARGMPNYPGPNPANPRAKNVYGQIVRWCERDGDPTNTTFSWSIFVTCGNREHATAEHRGDIRDAADTSEQDYGSPDGLWLDPRGILWVQTDVSRARREGPDYARFGNNHMLAVDPRTAATRRFMVGPRGCELTGSAMTPDFRTMFVNVQHPGEPTAGLGDPAAPLAVSAWPNGAADQRPRSATVVIRRRDGRPIGE